MRVHLYTDAGVKDGLATWGCVAVVDGVATFEASGRMRGETADSTLAELRAAANALHKVIRAGIVQRGDSVWLICDSAWTVGLVRGKVSPGGAHPKRAAARRHAEALAVVHKVASDSGLILTARGVKGHQPLKSKCPHAPHNRRCDQLCREARA